ncbi:hypothetical protein RFY41_05740 [Acinetobacter soli]|uniref:hypothetical protein n=1 Tax=Acinetobacter soli TaxID=487316 RepID=UPI00281459D1|nr:hypothetical protein [Acinetobacter soli]MDQ9832550.1 hypothetical protein [Acinetobacter soli]
MSSDFNRHGLSRNIPSEIKAKIRQDDGYGCVKCGNIFIQYEHIEPLFCDAKIHDPDKITLLCSGCHDESTGKRLPKRIISSLKKNPYCKRLGFTRSKKFYPNPDQMKIKIGNSTFTNTDIAITIYGKPIIWVTKDYSDPYSPLLYNAIFMDSNGKKIGYLNNNEFVGIVGSCDFQAISNRIEVRSKKGEINLILEIEGDGFVNIKRLFFKYKNITLKLDKDGSIQINENFRFEVKHIDNCLGGLKLMDTLNTRNPYNFMTASIYFTKAQQVSDISGNICGYIRDSEIFDLKFNFVGLISENKVYNLFNEYIGNIFKNNNSYIHIVMEKFEYPDQEPIWISPTNKKIFFFQRQMLIDTSYRLFNL